MIEIDDLSKKFGDVEAIRSLTLKINSGERWGVIGHNGSGKTTLLKLMMGLFPPTSGSVKFNGITVDNKIRKKIGFVSQSESLDATLTVYENLFFFGLYHGLTFKDSKQRAEELLKSIDFKAGPTTIIDNLSGGNRKKVLILRSFMLDPEYLFMDEPSNHLDLHSRVWLNDLSNEFTRKGKTIVLTSHDITDVENTCDQILIMFNGQMVAAGPKQKLLHDHFQSSVIEYVVDGEPDEGDYNLIRKYHGQLIGTRCFLFPMTDNPEKILEEIQSSSVTVRNPGLKDLYVKLTHMEII